MYSPFSHLPTFHLYTVEANSLAANTQYKLILILPIQYKLNLILIILNIS
jgi:hypothetical protein